MDFNKTFGVQSVNQYGKEVDVVACYLQTGVLTLIFEKKLKIRKIFRYSCPQLERKHKMTKQKRVTRKPT